jgi:mannose-6-phosphate isomerase class I
VKKSNYDKFPFIQVEPENTSCIEGWTNIAKKINSDILSLNQKKVIVAIECYQGILHEELTVLQNLLVYNLWIDAEKSYKNETAILSMIGPDMTDDSVFGYLTQLDIEDYFDSQKLNATREEISKLKEGTVIVYGSGSGRVVLDFDLLIYADMPRWEIQLRMRRNEVNNLGVRNKGAEFAHKYKQGYFIDWRVCDRLKRRIYDRSHYVLDTTTREEPKLIRMEAVRKGFSKAVAQPFRVVPFFDPGPWGGQWMKEKFDLDADAPNYAWCFDCVPEENSLLLSFGDVRCEFPSINLVFFKAKELLGQQIQTQFGEEFPIRFDLLDTMNGGNLSLQVHPLTAYISEEFGMPYTQDESYYILDAAPGACAYLGVKEQGTKDRLFNSLDEAYKENHVFEVEDYVNRWPVKKHDHLSIPAGTIHCSGANTMVLEISATPYIFTFKLWDWNRLGLDGKPRPIHLEHGRNNLQEDRDENWVKENALNLVTTISSGDGWREERTGLNELEFIETRRHWFTSPVYHHTNGNLNVLNLVEGKEVIVESPEKKFDPFIVHYAETFIVPAAVGPYTISPFGEAIGTECATMKAFIR